MASQCKGTLCYQLIS
ncbi:hypothetical protein BIW11_13981 [Tropilaelaps mercedesae]|uniref:Uncharacterized protein n=1 Tax=Tropilaelaps mercedesae TaxID=418985 RepID=A0A1V9WZL6_9ACAR|nr:hypothetical protein BIW11_13981 [Tropilaelaps mercedesae]